MEVEFRCVNCGNMVEKNLLPWKHAVLGAIPAVNRNSSCCEKPDYEDLEGFQEAKSERSLRRRVPRFA